MAEWMRFVNRKLVTLPGCGDSDNSFQGVLLPILFKLTRQREGKIKGRIIKAKAKYMDQVAEAPTRPSTTFDELSYKIFSILSMMQSSQVTVLSLDTTCNCTINMVDSAASGNGQRGRIILAYYPWLGDHVDIVM